MSYADFLLNKSKVKHADGFKPVWMPDFLFDFQKALVDWSVRKGRAAIFADCGLGKTPMQLVWAENVLRKTNGNVLILTPLAVSSQTVREGEKFGIRVSKIRDGKTAKGINVVNYEQLHKLNPKDFAGVVCDESSCLKAMNGKRRAEVTEFCRSLRYRLLCTATAAPNDYVELGTSSETLGAMGQRDMLTMFFKQETKKDWLGWGRVKYRMKGHAWEPFWRWVCSWARACRRPSDLGFKDDKFVLPELEQVEHVVKVRNPVKVGFFEKIATTMQEERDERRRTVQDRCEKVAELVRHKRPAIVWCHLNQEGDLLEKLIRDGRQIKGSDDLEKKEQTWADFISGKLRVVITKPKIGAFGLNLQHCSHVVEFASHSYESHYQAVRRCWRFGQKRTVRVDSVVTEGERRIAKNLEKKMRQVDAMFTSLVRYMNESLASENSNGFLKKMEVPKWLI